MIYRVLITIQAFRLSISFHESGCFTLQICLFIVKVNFLRIDIINILQAKLMYDYYQIAGQFETAGQVRLWIRKFMRARIYRCSILN